MINVSDLEKMEINRGITYAIAALALIVPGTAYVYMYFRDTFLILSTFKLIVVALFISLPVFVTNIFAMMYISANTDTIIKTLSKLDDETLKQVIKGKVTYGEIKEAIDDYHKHSAEDKGENETVLTVFIASVMTIFILFIPILSRLLIQKPHNFLVAVFFVIILQLVVIIFSHLIGSPSQELQKLTQELQDLTEKTKKTPVANS